jgi:hypothetical protein
MKVIRLNEFEKELEGRKAALGYIGRDFVRPNSGITRSPEKRALLRALEDARREDGKELRFYANY